MYDWFSSYVFFPRYSNTKPALVLLIPLHHEQETWWQGSSLGMMRSPELPWLLSNAPGLVTSPLSWTRKTIINECLNALICLNSLVEVYPVDCILNTSVNIWDTERTNSSTLGKLIPCFTCQKPQSHPTHRSNTAENVQKLITSIFLFLYVFRAGDSFITELWFRHIFEFHQKITEFHKKKNYKLNGAILLKPYYNKVSRLSTSS